MRTEREKMLAGEAYNSRDRDLLREAFKARQLTAKLLSTAWDDHEGMAAVLRELLGHMGRNVWVEPPFFCDYGSNITIGDDSLVNGNCVFLDCGLITIGKNVLIGPAVQLYAVGHPVAKTERITPDWQGPDDSRPPYWNIVKPISIGDNVWIGGSTVILPGVSIGESTVIGAGSVVSKDMPAGVLACGNPCRVIREL